jgi:hypothetical protein
MKYSHANILPFDLVQTKVHLRFFLYETTGILFLKEIEKIFKMLCYFSALCDRIIMYDINF